MEESPGLGFEGGLAGSSMICPGDGGGTRKGLMAEPSSHCCDFGSLLPVICFPKLPRTALMF